MTTQAIKNQQEVAEIRLLFYKGFYTHIEAKMHMQPVLDRINATGKELAKKHGKRPKLISFAEVMR